MNNLKPDGLVQLTGIAAPFMRHDMLIDYIAPPIGSLHAHGSAVITPAGVVGNASGQALRQAFPLDRYLADGSENPEFILNRAPWRNASILLAGRNFGIGGTRTPAAARLLGDGIRAVIAPSFGQVFFDDCIQAGLLPVILGQEQVEAIAAAAVAAPRRELTIDLRWQTISRPDIGPITFQMSPRLRARFMEGLSDIDETTPFQREAEAFQRDHELRQPWIYRSTGDQR